MRTKGKVTSRLTIKQKKFADNYIKTRDVYNSALKAGYSRTYSKSGAYSLLDHEAVAAYLEQRLNRLDMSKIATQDEILQGLTRIWRREETEDVTNVVKEMKPVYYDVDVKNKDGEIETMRKVKIANVEHVELARVRNSVSDSMKAGLELLKVVGYTTQNRTEMARLRKAIAEAKIAERKANGEDVGDVTINVMGLQDSEYNDEDYE